MDGQSNIVIKPALLELFEQAWAQTSLPRRFCAAD